MRREYTGEHIALVAPYYAGGLSMDIVEVLKPRPVSIEAIGVPREILSRYDQPEQHDETLGLSPNGIRGRIVDFLAP